jgi:hypothetical protein
MKSAEARLQAIGIFHHRHTQRFTSGSCGCGSSDAEEDQKSILPSLISPPITDRRNGPPGFVNGKIQFLFRIVLRCRWHRSLMGQQHWLNAHSADRASVVVRD